MNDFMKLDFKISKDIIRVYNKYKTWLGTISYDDEWKCWIWVQEPNIRMSAGCLSKVLSKLRGMDKI